MLDASHSSEGCTKSLWPPHSTYPPSNHSGTPSRLYRSKNLMDFVVRSRSAEAFHHTLNICHVAEIIPFTCAWNLILCGLHVESTLARCYQIISISCPCLLLGVSLKYLCVYVLNLMLPFSLYVWYESTWRCWQCIMRVCWHEADVGPTLSPSPSAPAQLACDPKTGPELLTPHSSPEQMTTHDGLFVKAGCSW